MQSRLYINVLFWAFTNVAYFYLGSWNRNITLNQPHKIRQIIKFYLIDTGAVNGYRPSKSVLAAVSGDVSHLSDSSECKTQTSTDLADSAAHPMAFLNSGVQGFSVK